MTSIPTERAGAPPRYNGVIFGLDENVYHAQPELSSTGARALLDGSPARFDYDRRRVRQGKSSYDVGHAAHAKILGVGLEVVVYPDEHLTPSGNVSTKAATVAWAEEQRAAGLAPVTPEQAGAVEAMSEAVLAHPLARRTLEAGTREVSMFARDPETGVRTRGRFDSLVSGMGVDLKTTDTSASAQGFGKSAAKYNYPVQEAWYADTLEWITGERVGMRWIVVEKARPHFVGVHEFDDTVRLIAAEQAAKARRIYAECMATDTWPAHGDDVIHTEIPQWWFSQNEEELPDSWT